MADGNIYLQNAASNSSGAGAAMTLNQRLVVTPDGNIGVNHSSPSYPLDIRHDGGNQNQTPIIRLFQSSDGCHNAITLESSTSADKNIGIQFKNRNAVRGGIGYNPVSYTHLRAHET